MKETLKKVNWLGVAQLVAVLGIALMPLIGATSADAQFINRFNCPANAGVRCGDTNLVDLFNTIINYALGIAFFIAVIFLIYGGFLYITSAGNEETATKGKNAVVYALIGIIIIVLSYVIVRVVYQFVAKNTIDA